MKDSTTPIWFIPALAVAVALVTGMLELPFMLLRWKLFLVAPRGNGHVFWTAAVTNLVLLTPIALLWWVINRIRPGARTERGAALVLFTIGAFALLSYVPRISAWGLLFLAFGIGVQGSGLALRRREAFHRGVRRLALTLPIFLLISAGLALAWTPLRERWLNRNLPAASGGAANVLLIVLDTVRAMRLSLYGYEKPTSPALERWAGSSTVFEQAIATSSWTLPSHAGMFTGRYPHELNAGFRTALDDRWPTLAEVLARHGYLTAGFSANKEYVSYQTGLNRGFARFQEYRVSPGQILLGSILGRRYFARRDWFRRLTRYYNIPGRKNARRVSDEFLSWLNREPAERPFFAFLNYYDAHDPYFAPPPFDRQFTSDTLPYRPPGWLMLKRATRELEAHEGTIAYLDLEVDRLLTELESRGLLENTLVIITSDHGEQFGEHDLMSHGNSLYHPLLDVPLILRLPGKVPQNLRIGAPVTLRDLPATVLDLVGVPGTEIPGSSWAPLWHAEAAPGTGSPLLSALTWPNGDIAYALRVGDYEYIDWFQKKEELYDLGRDPGETRNLASESDRAISASYRAQRDSIVGDIYRPPEMNRLQMWLTGSPGRTRPKRDRQGGDSD